MTRTYRYYCLYRPPAPGAIPRGACAVDDFGQRIPILEIGGREAWGYAEYPIPLEDGVAEQYEVEASRANPDYKEGDHAAERND